jgi:hypothetical protein
MMSHKVKHRYTKLTLKKIIIIIVEIIVKVIKDCSGK